jgi:hypothetical protein
MPRSKPDLGKNPSFAAYQMPLGWRDAEALRKMWVDGEKVQCQKCHGNFIEESGGTG